MKNINSILKTATLVLASLVVSFVWQSPAAQASSGNEAQGIVQSMPASGTIGTWVIDGQSFSVGAATRIELKHGALAIGSCAEVKYVGSLAKKIESKRAGECTNSDGSGDNDDNGDNDGDHDDSSDNDNDHDGSSDNDNDCDNDGDHDGDHDGSSDNDNDND